MKPSKSQRKENPMIRKILLAAGAAALMSTPAWALPGQAPSNPGKGHGPNTPNTGSPGHSGDRHGKSHKCLPHSVGYVASGTLVLANPPLTTLTKNADGTYSGTLEVEVTKTNHHAAADKGKTVTYKVSKAHVTFGLKDTNSDGSVGLDDLAKGDRVHLNGKITTLAKKCDQTGFTAETTIRGIVFHAPAPEAGKG